MRYSAPYDLGPRRKVAALFKAADALEDQGKFTDAYRAYQDVLKLGPNPEAKKKSDFCAWMVERYAPAQARVDTAGLQVAAGGA